MNATARVLRNEFAALLEKHINVASMTQLDLARTIGYENPNIITMFKKGSTRVPLEKVAPLAVALDLDPAMLLRLWFQTFVPEALVALEEHMGMVLTRSEKSWVVGLRDTFKTVPPYDRRIDKDLKALMGSVAV